MFWPVQVFDENLEFWHFVRIRVSFLQLHVLLKIKASEHQSIKASEHQGIRASEHQISDYIWLYSIIFDYIRLYSIIFDHTFVHLSSARRLDRMSGHLIDAAFCLAASIKCFKKAARRLDRMSGPKSAQSWHKVGTKSAQSRHKVGTKSPLFA